MIARANALLASMMVGSMAAPLAAQSSSRQDVRAVEDAAVRAELGEPPIPANAVRVRIRYPQTMGYLDTSPFRGDTLNTCGAFVVEALIMEGAEGTFGRERIVPGEVVREPRMRRVGRQYVCDFTLAGVPLDRPLTIRARVSESDALYRAGAWRGGDRLRPPLGHERVLDRGGMRRVTLTARARRATVDFEMRYARVRTPAAAR